jgi:hypothetical protein
MRILTKTMMALGFVGTLAVGGASPTLAQGVYLGVPGVGVEIGRPAYRHYRYYDGPYAYGPRHYYGPRYYRYDRDW